jgi:hypothetical protein
VAGVVALVGGVSGQRHESVDGVGEVPELSAGCGGVPVDKCPLVVADDEVPGRQVVVGDDFVPVGRDERLPVRAGRRDEPGDGVMKVADEAGNVAQLAVTVQQVKVSWPGDRAGDEGEDLASAFVDAERPGCAVEADSVEMDE